MTTIALATDSEHPRLTDGDRSLIDALDDRTIEAEPVIWDDERDWSRFDAVILRSTWDYVDKIDAFTEWIQTLETTSVEVWNPPEVLRWNLNKMYLKELREAGQPVVPSVFLPEGTSAPLDRIAREKNWDDVVLKPLIGAGASDLKRFDSGCFDEGQAWLDYLTKQHGAIIQPYDDSVRQNGEWSFVFFNRTFEYAVRKFPAGDDYRVQTELGGTREGAQAPGPLVDQAKDIVGSITNPYLYARVDGFERNGRLRLLEIEMIEPALYLDQAEEGAGRFAVAIDNVLEKGAEVNYFDHAKVVDEGGNGMNPG